jgi:hypothetical protein
MASKSIGKSVLEKSKGAGRLKEKLEAKKAPTKTASATTKPTPAPAATAPTMQKKKMAKKAIMATDKKKLPVAKMKKC